jgi:hypothetical protein
MSRNNWLSFRALGRGLIGLFRRLHSLNWPALIAAGVFLIAVWSLRFLPQQSAAPHQYPQYHAQRTENYQKESEQRHRVSEQSQPKASFVQYIATNYAKPYSAYCAEDPKSKDEKWLHQFSCEIRSTDFVIAAFTIILALFTTVLAVTGFWQVVVTRRAFRRQLRAYIHVVGCRREGPHKNRLVFVLTMRNAGQTPAYKVTTISGHIYAPADSHPQVDLSEPSTSFALGPNSEVIHEHGLDYDLTDAEMAGIDNGSGVVFFRGKISYKTAFGGRHHTWFNYAYAQSSVSRGTLAYCEGGNDAD